MRNPHCKSTSVQLAILCGVILASCLSPVARADADPHAQQDKFAAEAAALLPAVKPPVAAATAPLDRIRLGEWGAVIPWTPHIPVSAATLPDGRILTFASNQRTTFPSGPEFTYAATWNPATGQFVEYNHPSHDMFCGALVMLPDGRVLVNGGRNTTVRSSIFDWRVNTWTRTPDMNDPRWYNTSVALPNGRVWTVSGSGGSGTAERWDNASGWSRLTGINWNTVLAEPGYINIWHPLLLLAPDGRLIHFGPTDTMHWVTTDGGGSLSNTGTVVPGSHYPKEGAWVMFNEGRILVAGGGANTTANASDTTTGNSTNLAYIVDVRTGTPVVTSAASMTFVRQFANSVVLPNGEVMVMGGNTSGLKFNDTGSVLTPEIWNPVTGLWRTAADASVPRNYHSLALLLPDGRVMSGGGGLGGGDHRDAQLFTPPTLYNADGTLATRPTLATAPTAIGVATTFTVTGTPGIQKFSFIKMSAITHSVNTDLRYLSLPFTETSSGNYQITAHSSLNVMTPGYWMLFGLNAAGTHSVAKVILVDAINYVSVAEPGSQSAYVNQPVPLQMIGSGPSGSVLAWSATGLPNGLSINSSSGLIWGTPTTLGSFSVTVTATDGNTSDLATFTWTIQPPTFSGNYPTFAAASGLTLNGNAVIVGGALRVAPNSANQAGSAFLSNPLTIGPDTSMNTRFVFRIHGSADGADGMTFMIQGVGVNALGATGAGLGYGGIGQSLAVEIDNYQGAGDANANHIAVLSGGDVATHLANFTPGWDLEDGSSHTMWIEYDGPANQLRVFLAQGIVTDRPATPAITLAVNLPALVGSQAWIGFSGGTGGLFNNHDVETWSLSINAFALPSPPVLTPPGNQITVVGSSVSLQMQATDPNGDLLMWSASGLPTGLSINPASGLITGTATVVGNYSPTVTVTDGNTTPVNAGFTWTINDVLTVAPLAGSVVASGSSVPLTAQSSGGLNPRFRWSFGDGTPDTAFSASPSASHVFANPGRFLVTVTVRDDTGREVTASYRQATHAPLTAARPTSSSSIAYEDRSGVNDRIWVVNPDNDSVTVFDAVTRAKLAEINVGSAPRTLALAPDGRVWVANAGSATLTILASDYSVGQTVTLPRGSRPYGVVFDPAGANLYVALEDGGNVLKLNSASGAIVASLNVGQHVRHLSVTADGATILASRFVSPRVPGEETASPQTTVNDVKHGGEVLAINAGTFTVDKTVVLEHSEASDTSNSGRGIPNYVGAAVISPDGLSAWAPSKQDNIKRGTLRNNSLLTHDMTVRSIASRIDLVSRTEDTGGRIDFDNAGIASASVFDPMGNFLFTALEGSREVAVADVWAKQEILRFDAGRAPQALVLSPDGRTLYVHNFMDRTISIHDISALANGAVTAPPAAAVLNCVTTEKLTAPVLLGKQFFYDTRDNRVAFQQYVSCAGCHNDGGQDGRVWDFTQFGEGLRNTITLRGHGGTAQGPLHWTGNFDEVQDFEGQIRNFARGTGLMTDADFHTGTRSQSLGDAKAGLSADLDALAAYVSSLTKNGDSPDRNTDGSMTSAAQAGQVVFQSMNCAQCHTGTKFTDSALNVFHSIGTGKPSSGQRLGGPLPGFDTPTLLGLFNTAPYLHDGSAATLEEAVNAHTGVTLNATDLGNLVAFLRQLDDAGAATLPATLTWANPAAITYGVALDGTQLNASANAPGTFTYSPAAGTVLNAGNAQVLSVTFTPTDLNAYGSATATVSIDVARVPLTITADDKTKVYGATRPTLTASYDGFVNGDNAASLDTPVALNSTGNASSPAGLYPISVSGAADANYDITFVSGMLDIGRAALTIAADNKVKAYGVSLPALTVSYTGLVNGDTPASLDTPPVLDTTATPSSNVGSYPISVAGAADANYEINFVGGAMNVVRAALTITADNKSKVYGAAMPGLTLSYSGFVNGDNAASLDTPAVLDTSALASSSVGSYPITVAGATAANYTITQLAGNLSVTRAPLTITADNNSKVYGAALSMFTASYSGFVNGDTASSLDTPVSLNTVASASSAVGGYPITASAAADANYTVAFVSGTLTVTRAALTVTADNKSKAYGAPLPVLTARYSGFVNGDTSASLDTPVSFSTTANAASSVGGYPIGVSNAADANYTIAFVVGTLNVTPAPLTIRANDISRPQGQANPALTATYTGFVNGDTAASLDTPVALATTADTSSPQGAYPITAAGASGANYTVTHVSGTLTVTAAFQAFVNFQPTGAVVPAGYLKDDGAIFANRGNGFSYGWNVSNTSFTRDRNSTRSLDQRYDTLNHMQKSGGGRSWEIAVPNGTYNVLVVAGDADNFDSVFRINVEGVLTASGTPTTGSRWVTGSKTVTVSDGRLTVSNGTGSSNNKICFINITSVPSAMVAIAPSVPAAKLTSVTRESDGQVTLQMKGDAGFLYQIETSTDLQTWEPLDVVSGDDGQVTIGDANSVSLPQRFYRARLLP